MKPSRPHKPIKLTELKPQFVRWEKREEADGEHTYPVPVATLAEAQGLRFLCPLCNELLKGKGVHQSVCWFEDAPAEAVPGPGRWKPKGTGYADLSFVPGKKSRSVRLIGGCNWHGFLTDGVLTSA